MQIIAHRGASGQAPENTLAAFRLAWVQGADGIEMDVHLSADGQVMVHHDEDTARCSDGQYVIADTQSAQLRQLDVGAWKSPQFAGERMPLLSEVLAEVPAGKRVLVEIKVGAEMAPALEQALHATPAGVEVALISFYPEALLACKARLPEIPTYWVVEGVGQPYRVSLEIIALAQQYGFTGLDPDWAAVDPDWVAAARAAGLRLLCWTVNAPAAALGMRALGLDGITTDYPAEQRQVLSTPSG